MYLFFPQRLVLYGVLAFVWLYVEWQKYELAQDIINAITDTNVPNKTVYDHIAPGFGQNRAGKEDRRLPTKPLIFSSAVLLNLSLVLGMLIQAKQKFGQITPRGPR